jgi:hypothetical protein
MHQASVPVDVRPAAAGCDRDGQLHEYMPPILLGIPNIYFAIIAAFVFVIIVFI